MIAIKANSTLWGWGCNLYNQLDGTDNDKYEHMRLTSALYQTASAGEAHTMAIKTDGTLWGNNYYGQIGNDNGFGGFERNPVQVGALTGWQSVSAGGYHTEAILGNVLFGWGYMLRAE